MIRNSLLNRKNWDNTAVIDEKKYYSYRDLAQKSIAIQRRLPQKQRENIGIFLPNSGNYIAALFGVIMSGMTAFPLNIQLTVHEIDPLLAQADVHALITSKTYRSLFEDIIETASVQVIYVEELPETECGAFHLPEDVGVDEPMILLSTSGTTGKAKIVQLSEKNVASSTLAYIDKMDFEKIPENELRAILGTPFCSAYGLMVLTACVIKSIPVVILKEAFTLDMLYKAAEEHKVTHFEGGVSVGLLMEQMAGRPVPYDISSFRYFGLAGSKISSNTLRRLTKSYPGVEFWPGYGMSEAGPLIAKPDKKVDMNKLDSVGTGIDCVTIKMDVNGVLTDTPHTRGEIVVKGPNVMLGYYKNEEETRKILKDGYLYTGDIGYLDEDGYLYICGRKKNVIIVRGLNVHAEEVEACILNSGLVKDCIVYGGTDSLENEIVCVDMIPMTAQIQTEEIYSYCKEHLANYKQPKRIKMIDTIRKTATGKTERALEDDQ